MQHLDKIVNFAANPIGDIEFLSRCKHTLDNKGALVLHQFLNPAALAEIKQEGDNNRSLAYYTSSNHNVYLQPTDPSLSGSHPRNRQIVSSKGCITDEEIPQNSALRALYDAPEFQAFLCAVLGEQRLYPYADKLSSINLHYASEGQELGWHFDNSSFAITLLIQKPEQGGVFEYVENLRDADGGEMNYDGVAKLLDGQIQPKKLGIEAGDLVLFRGRNAIHRVTPTGGNTTRMLAVLAYNSRPDISLSETARRTFYGRI